MDSDKRSEGTLRPNRSVPNLLMGMFFGGRGGQSTMTTTGQPPSPPLSSVHYPSSDHRQISVDSGCDAVSLRNSTSNGDSAISNSNSNQNWPPSFDSSLTEDPFVRRNTWTLPSPKSTGTHSSVGIPEVRETTQSGSETGSTSSSALSRQITRSFSEIFSTHRMVIEDHGTGSRQAVLDSGRDGREVDETSGVSPLQSPGGKTSHSPRGKAPEVFFRNQSTLEPVNEKDSGVVEPVDPPRRGSMFQVAKMELQNSEGSGEVVPPVKQSSEIVEVSKRNQLPAAGSSHKMAPPEVTSSSDRTPENAVPSGWGRRVIGQLATEQKKMRNKDVNMLTPQSW